MPHSTSTAFKRSAAPPSVDAWIAAVAARQHALITFVQLLRVLTPGAITHRVKRGLLHRRYRGIYVVGQPTLSREGEWLAAALACGGALGYLSCGALHGVSRFGEPMIEVVTTSRARPEGVRVHTVRRLDPRELTSHKGIPVTTIHRLLVDLTDEKTPHQVANVIHKAAFLGRFVEPAVRDAMARANGRRKLHVLERAIELHRMGSAGTRSRAEDAFLQIVEPEPLVNMDLLGFEVDFRWPDQRLVVEVDGPSTRFAPTPTRRATVHSTPRAGPSCASATARSTSVRRASWPRSRPTASRDPRAYSTRCTHSKGGPRDCTDRDRIRTGRRPARLLRDLRRGRHAAVAPARWAVRHRAAVRRRCCPGCPRAGA